MSIQKHQRIALLTQIKEVDIAMNAHNKYNLSYVIFLSLDYNKYFLHLSDNDRV